MAEAIAKLCERFQYGNDEPTLGIRWAFWLAQFRVAVKASQENNKDVIKSTFLTRIGSEAFRVYETLKKEDESDTLDDVIKMLTDRFVYKGSEMAQRVRFGFEGKRRDGESVDQFVIRLRDLAKYCGFKDLEENVTYQLIIGCGIEQLRRKISRGKTEHVTLTDAIEMAKGYEREAIDASLLAKAAREPGAAIHHLSTSGAGRGDRLHQSEHRRQDNEQTRHGGATPTVKCDNCKWPRHSDMSQCPARNKECFRCHKIGHFGGSCRSPNSSGDNSRGARGSIANVGNHNFRGNSSENNAARDGRKQNNNGGGAGVKFSSRTRVHEVDQDCDTHVVSAQEYADFRRYQSMLDNEVLALEQGSRFNSGPRAELTLCGTRMTFLVDTGAPINVIDEQAWCALASKPHLDTCNGNFYGVGSDKPIELLGQFTSTLHFRGSSVKTGFIVVRGSSRSLLSFSAASQLGIVKICSELSSDESPRKPKAASKSRMTLEELKATFPSAFSSKLGCVKGHVVKLELDPSVQPVKQRLRPIAIHLREAVSKELDDQVRDGVLERVTDPSEPTPWISNLVVVPKGSKPVAIARTVDPLVNWTSRRPRATLEPAQEPMRVRLTCDSKALNKALKRARFPTKTIDDIIDKVSGARIFSKLDLAKAFHQLELAEESRPLTTIVTHQGLYRYRRLHMGISSASEIFTETIRAILSRCNGVLNMTDDILIFGATDDEHHNNLMSVLQTLEDNGITLNGDKCAFYQTEVTFFGLRFSKDGVSPTEDRCRALREATPPSNVKELRSLLGMVQYSARFINELAHITEPLWRLTKDGTEWIWADEQQRAFEALKQAITQQCLAFFRRDWLTEVVVDASPVGLGAILAQTNPHDESDRRIVCFASRLLTATERRYSQCEKEALAAVWACERFWLYLFGSRFRLVTDNRAVQLIFGPSETRPPARIERWALRLTQFDYEIVHRPGKLNAADFLSRQPDRSVDLSALVNQQATERYINSITFSALPMAITRAEIARTTADDDELMALKTALTEKQSLWPACLDSYRRVASELSCTGDGIILRGSQILVPHALRARVVLLAHRGHQGIVQTKRLIRSRLWFPGIDAQVEQAVRQCHFCQAAEADARSYEPLRPSPMPEGPWQSVAGDFFGPIDGKYLFVNICRYSRWFEVAEISALTADVVTAHLRQLFTTFGAPLEYMSDNGPPFDAHTFATFAQEFGFSHRRVTPYWPRANGAAEAVMKKLARVVQFAKEAGISKRAALSDFLRAYRATPHSATGVAPADLMLGHSRACGLPRLEPTSKQQRAWHSLAKENDKAAKSKMEAEYNARMRVRECAFRVGDRVLLRRDDKRKSDTRWDSSPYTVTAVNGSMVTAARPDRQATRNSSWFKPFYGAEDKLCEDQPLVNCPVEVGDERTSPSSIQVREESAPAEDRPLIAKQPVGRPSKSTSIKLAAERERMYEQQRRANPPSRSSNRLATTTTLN